jgi:hypothetical protein
MERGRVKDEAVKKATGKTWNEWFTILDKAGARKEDHSAIAGYLSSNHIKNGWWAQMVTVEYEREHGMRKLLQRTDGSYSVTAHRTVDMPVSKLFSKWQRIVREDATLQRKKITPTTVRANKTIRYTIRYKGSDERVIVAFAAKDPASSRIGIDHERLASKSMVETSRAFWKKLLAKI